MELAYKEIERNPPNSILITDLIERGLVLALRELGVTDFGLLPLRVKLNDFEPELARYLYKAAVLFRWPKYFPLSKTEALYRDFIIAIADSAPEWPDYEEAVKALGVKRP